MLGYLRHLVVAPFVKLWLATSAESWKQLPRASGVPLVHALGSDSDRVLLLGGGIAVGYGVASHELGLAGHLARELSALTGRGASVDILVEPDMSIVRARALLARTDLGRFDAVAINVGGFEALTLVTARTWRKHLDSLLTSIAASTPESVSIFMIAVAPIPALVRLPRGIAGAVGSRVRLINEETRAVCDRHPWATFVQFDPKPESTATATSRQTYLEWAALIAPQVGAALDAQVGRVRPAGPDEDQRQAALDELDLDSLPEHDFDQIVITARNLFGASGASVSIIDRDQQRFVAACGMSRDPIPRSDSLCAIAIEHPGLLVIEDTMLDPRVAGTPWASGEVFRFYAGYPIESPRGFRLGALCIVDMKPRKFSDSDAALLRELALRVQSLIWAATRRVAELPHHPG